MWELACAAGEIALLGGEKHDVERFAIIGRPTVLVRCYWRSFTW